jgi:hypothetical protein
VYLLFLALVQYRKKELRLHQGFASGKCGATAGLVVKNNIFFDFGHDLTDGYLPPDDFSCTSQTSINAFATQVAYFYIGHRLVISGRNCLMSAYLYALTAPNTSACSEAEFRMFLPAFGILAPLTIQWAAFEEHCSADARTVVYGVLLDVEDESGHLEFGLFGLRYRRGWF